jgi:hypothetical protein
MDADIVPHWSNQRSTSGRLDDSAKSPSPQPTTDGWYAPKRLLLAPQPANRGVLRDPRLAPQRSIAEYHYKPIPCDEDDHPRRKYRRSPYPYDQDDASIDDFAFDVPSPSPIDSQPTSPDYIVILPSPTYIVIPASPDFIILSPSPSPIEISQHDVIAASSPLLIEPSPAAAFSAPVMLNSAKLQSVDPPAQDHNSAALHSATTQDAIANDNVCY